jgi:hypothetical protein
MENDELVQNMLLEATRHPVSVMPSQLNRRVWLLLLKALSDQGMEIDQSTLYPCSAGSSRGTVTVRLAHCGRSPSTPVLRISAQGQGAGTTQKEWSAMI